MVLPRLIAIIMISASGAALAQQAPVLAQPPAAVKPDKSQQVSCRVSREGNTLRRTCMKNSDWAKVDSTTTKTEGGQVFEQRCNEMGAC
jgi:hypothetical protein